MERRSFLKTVGAAGLAVGVTPAWSLNHVANREGADPGSSEDEKASNEASPEKMLLKD